LRIVVAFEAGRDGFWLARWLRAREIEAYVIHPSSVPVSLEHRRAKTDRIDTELLKRAFLGWLRGEPKHCSMAAIRPPSRSFAADAHDCIVVAILTGWPNTSSWRAICAHDGELPSVSSQLANTTGGPPRSSKACRCTRGRQGQVAPRWAFGHP
jgi:hypothetical protein